MAGKSAFARFSPVVPVLIVIAGLTLVAVGVGMIYLPAGVIVGGIALFALEWYISDRRMP